MKHEVHMKHLCCIWKEYEFLQEKSVSELQAELAAFLMQHHFYMKEQWGQTMAIHTWNFGRHFLENE